MANQYTPSVGIQGGLYPMGNFKPFNANHVYQPTAETLPDDGIAQVGVMYFLGEITSLTGGFPSEADMGDMVYLSFYTGTTIPTLSVTTNNHIGLDLDLAANKCYEVIGLWNGTEWVFATREVDR